MENMNIVLIQVRKEGYPSKKIYKDPSWTCFSELQMSR